MAHQRNNRLLVVSLALMAALAELIGGRFDVPVSVKPIPIAGGACSLPRSAGPFECRFSEGWLSTPQGWQLPAGQNGYLLIRADVPVRTGLSRWVFREPRSTDGRISLLIEGETAPNVHARIHVSRDGQKDRLPGEGLPFDGTRFEMPVEVGSRQPIQVRVEWIAPTTASVRASARLSRVHVQLLAPPPSVPNLAIAALLVLVPLLAYGVREAAGVRSATAYAVAVLGGMVALLEALTWSRTPISESVFWRDMVADGRDFDLYLLAPYLLLLGLLGWFQLAGQPSPQEQNRLAHLALAGALVWGLSRRLVAFAHAAPFKLDPDALGYMQIAGSLASPYETQLREPLWIWVVRLWLGAAGWDAPAMRLLTVCCSMLVVWLAYKLFTDYTDKPLLGLCVAWLLADNDYLIQLSVRGLREEAYMAALLGVIYVVFVRHRTLSLGWQAIGLAVAGASAQLLRFTSSAILIPLVLLWGWRAGIRRWRYPLCVLLAIGAVSVPHMVHNYRAFGDPLYSINIHFSWFRNYEVVVQRGGSCDGCPTREEFAANPYAGPPITARQYVFGLHSWRELIEDTLEGYRRMYLAPTDLFLAQSGTASAVGYGLFLIGLVAMLMGPHREMVFVVPLLANLLPFVMLRDADIRLAVHTAPFVTFILVYGAYWVAGRLITLPQVLERVCPALARIRVEWSRGLVPRTANGTRVVCR
jgi:hypothetical protein